MGFIERSVVRLTSLTGALSDAAREAAGGLIARTTPSGLLSLAGLVSVAPPAKTAHDTGAKKPLADGRGYRVVAELSGSISFETSAL